MPTCGDCEYFWSPGVITQTTGFCNKQPTGDKTYKVVGVRSDASKCDMFAAMSEVITDTAQSGHMLDHRLRRYKEYEYKEIDVKVDPEKLKDEKAWG